MQQVGLSAFFNTQQFTQGLQTYTAGLTQAATTTTAASAQIQTANPTPPNLQSATQAFQAFGADASGNLTKAYTAVNDFKSALLPAGAILTGFGVAAKQAFNLSAEGAAILQTRASFDGLLQKLGASPEILNRMRIATRGTIDDMTLMSSTQTLLAGTSGNLSKAFLDALPGLAEIAKAANKLNPSLGSTQFLFESLAAGVKRGSTEVLDNLGIIVKTEQAQQTYADSIGKTTAQLTAEEKTMALLNATMTSGAAIIAQAGGNAISATDNFARLGVTIKNMADEAKTGLAGFGSSFALAADVMLTGTKRQEELFKANTDAALTAGTAWEDYARKQLLARASAGQLAPVFNAVEQALMEQGATTEEITTALHDSNAVVETAIGLGMGYGATLDAVNYASVQNSRALDLSTQSYRDVGAEASIASTRIKAVAAAETEAIPPTQSAKDALAAYGKALTAVGITGQAYSKMLQDFGRATNTLNPALQQTESDITLLSSAFELGIVGPDMYTYALEGLAAGTVNLTDAQRAQLEAQIAITPTAEEAARAEQAQATALDNAAKAAAGLATSLKGASQAQVAQSLIGMFDPAVMGAEAYAAATRDVGLSFGLMDKNSIALADTMPKLAEAIQSGVIPTEKSDAALQALIKDAKDGKVDWDALLAKFGETPAAAGAVQTAMGITGTAFDTAATKVRNFRGDIDRLPTDKTVGIRMPTLDNARQTVIDLGEAITALPDSKTITITTVYNSQGDAPPDEVIDPHGKPDDPVPTVVVPTTGGPDVVTRSVYIPPAITPPPLSTGGFTITVGPNYVQQPLDVGTLEAMIRRVMTAALP
jgi:hypothetical protein